MRSLASIAGAVLLVVASLGSIAVAVSRAASRRIGWALAPALAAAALLIGLFGGPIWAAIALLATAAGFWLFDRGIPGNRPRPGWLRAWAVVLAIMSVIAIVLAIMALGAT